MAEKKIISPTVWQDIEKQYVFGIAKDGGYYMPSYAELAEKIGVNRSTVLRQARKGGWDLKRESFKNTNVEKIFGAGSREKSEKNIKPLQRPADVPILPTITQDHIDQVAETVSQAVMEFDAGCARVGEETLNLIRENLKKLKTAQAAEGYVDAEAIQDNIKALETAQKIFKNAINQALPSPDQMQKVVVEVVPARTDAALDDLDDED